MEKNESTYIHWIIKYMVDMKLDMISWISDEGNNGVGKKFKFRGPIQ